MYTNQPPTLAVCNVPDSARALQQNQHRVLVRLKIVGTEDVASSGFGGSARGRENAVVSWFLRWHGIRAMVGSVRRWWFVGLQWWWFVGLRCGDRAGGVGVLSVWFRLWTRRGCQCSVTFASPGTAGSSDSACDLARSLAVFQAVVFQAVGLGNGDIDPPHPQRRQPLVDVGKDQVAECLVVALRHKVERCT